MAPPIRFSAEADGKFEKYMRLQSQEEALRRRLSLHIPSAAPMTASTPEYQSLASSPTYSTPAWSPGQTYPSPSSPLSTRPNSQHRHNSISDMEDAHRLSELNQEMKACLTELLNTESVRSDKKSRGWVQGRLMAAEQQIRHQRRRRSSSNEDKDFASSIASNLELGLSSCKTWG